MKLESIVFALCFAAVSRAGVVAVVTEDTFQPIPGVPPTERVEKNVVRDSFFFDGMRTLTKWTGATGKALASGQRYQVKDGRLWRDAQELCRAWHILVQAETRYGDVLVVLRMQNQFSSPLKLIRAVAGHPIQVFDVLLVVVKDGQLVRAEKILEKRETAWLRAELFEEPNQPPQTTTGSSAPDRV